jgi:flagellar protein FlaJ
MLYSIEGAQKINRRLVGFGRVIASIFPGLKYDLRSAGIDIEPGAYAVAVFISSLFWGLFFYLFTYIMLSYRWTPRAELLSLLPGVLVFLLFSLLNFFYPRIIAGKLAEGVDKDLVYALKDMYIQINSGVSLFNAMVAISKADYGYVSKDFEGVVKKINAGESEENALEELAFRSKSEYFKKAIWQLITAIRAGASVEGSLRNVIDVLLSYQHRAIKNYSAELNFWILIYMLMAATVPTIGITLSVVLSAFGRFGITPTFFIYLVIFSFLIQIILVGFIKSRRPEVYL